MKNVSFPIKKSLPAILLFSLTCFIIYVVGQQGYRMSANDPQFQLASDYAQAINQGTNPGILINPAYTIELSKSLSPFIIIMDKNGKLISTNATLNSVPQAFPKGFINPTLQSGVEAITWQPEKGIREATVLMVAGQKNEYVIMAGRSLLKVEERINVLGFLVIIGWTLSIILYCLSLWLLEPHSETK